MSSWKQEVALAARVFLCVLQFAFRSCPYHWEEDRAGVWVVGTCQDFWASGIEVHYLPSDGMALQRLVTNYSGEQNPSEEKYWNILQTSRKLKCFGPWIDALVQMLMNRGTYGGIKLLDSTSVDQMKLCNKPLWLKPALKLVMACIIILHPIKVICFMGIWWCKRWLAHYVYNTQLNIGYIVLVNYDGQGFGKLNDAVDGNRYERSVAQARSSVLWHPRTKQMDWLLPEHLPTCTNDLISSNGCWILSGLWKGRSTPTKISTGWWSKPTTPIWKDNSWIWVRMVIPTRVTFTENDDHETVMIAGFAIHVRLRHQEHGCLAVLGALALLITTAGRARESSGLSSSSIWKWKGKIAQCLPGQIKLGV